MCAPSTVICSQEHNELVTNEVLPLPHTALEHAENMPGALAPRGSV